MRLKYSKWFLSLRADVSGYVCAQDGGFQKYIFYKIEFRSNLKSSEERDELEPSTFV